MTFNEKPAFPYTYGDLVVDDGNRISDSILKLIDDPKFKNSLKSMLLSMLVIASYSSPAKATDLNDGAKLANEVLGSKGATVAFKELTEGVLKLARSKPGLILSTTMVCCASYPIPPTPTSWSLTMACGLLISETLK